MSTAVAVVLFIGVTAYAVFGGADFGAGFWDLIAGGAERGARPRALIDHSIGPVWEANHVWLIFVFVVLWTAFPEAYASITLTLFVPLTHRRARHRAARRELRVPQGGRDRTRDRRDFGAAFAVSSVLVPYCMGAVAGGIASGRVPAGGEAGDPVDSWINPTSILGGRARRRGGRLPGRRLPGLGRPPPRRRRDWSSTSGAARSSRPSSPVSSASSGSSCCTPTRRTSSTA